MKKGWKIALLLLLVLVVIGGVIIVTTPTKKLISLFAPKIDRVRITDVRLDEQMATMNLLANVQPSLLSGVVDSLTYTFTLYGTTIAKGQKAFTEAERQGKTQTLKLPVRMNHNVTRELVRRQVREGEKVRAHLQVFSQVPLLGKREFTVDEEMDIIVPALPGQELVNVELEDFGLDNMEMTMTMLIDNPNSFDFYVRRYDIKMRLKDYAFTSGKLKKTYLIKAQSKTPVQVQATSDIKTPVKTAFKAIFGDKDWPYHMTMHSVLEPKSDVVGSIEMDGEKTGSINIVQQLKKIKETKKAVKKAEKEEKKESK